MLQYLSCSCLFKNKKRDSQELDNVPQAFVEIPARQHQLMMMSDSIDGSTSSSVEDEEFFDAAENDDHSGEEGSGVCIESFGTWICSFAITRTRPSVVFTGSFAPAAQHGTSFL